MERVLPVLFNTDMVRATLREVRPKTMTRRTIKGYIPSDAIFGYTAFTPEGHISCRGTFADGYGEKFFKLPCQKGDILYVRETWGVMSAKRYDASVNIAFKAGGENKTIYFPNGGTDSINRNEYDGFIRKWDKFSTLSWHPSIHMPKEAARIWLKVTDVKVERLQDITNKQILMEGVSEDAIEHLIKQMPEKSEEYIRTAYLTEWSWVWDSIIKNADIERYGYEANPWVWVIEFERYEKPEELC